MLPCFTQAGVSQSGGSYGVNAALLELQLEPDHTTQLAQIQPLETRASSLVDLGCNTPDAAKGKEGAAHLDKGALAPHPGLLSSNSQEAGIYIDQLWI